MIKTSGSLLKAMDPQWFVEAGLLRLLCGSSAESRASASILVCLPSADVHVSVPAALAALEVLNVSQSMKLSPPGPQAGLRYIIKTLSSLSMGITLTEDLKACSKLVRQALQRFQFFLVFTNEKKEELKGEAAFEALLKFVSDCVGKKHEVTDEHFADLQTFAWLAPAGQEERVGKVLKAIAENQPKKKAKATDSKSAAPASASASGSAGGSSSSKDKNLGKEAALRYFST